MEIQFQNISLNFEVFEKNNSPDFILFLHGFTGSTQDWVEIIPHIDPRFNCATMDFVGHGKSGSPIEINFYNTGSIVEQINSVVENIRCNKIILLGYSMGGRAALNFAIKYPEKVKAMILESATPGITGDNLRSQRVQNDVELSKFILNNPIEKFVDYWTNIDLFMSQKNLAPERISKIRENKLKNNPVGLSNSLKGFSTGKMPPLFDKLGEIEAKTLLISGEIDDKFTAINFSMEKNIRNSGHKIIKNAGHNTHIENPDDFIYEVNNFLKQF
jgi:2-succinyl-6-hydroxy-2,4-cyclohexadiene-1-carboxylate synthase